MPAAAFQATYSDWKVIKGRKVVQIVVEIPIEQADLAYQVVGGMPNPAAEAWLAVARINPNAAKEEAEQSKIRAERPKQNWTDMSLAQQSGILCADKSFQTFLYERGFIMIKDEVAAAEYVRSLCQITSRSLLRANTPAGHRWSMLVSDYRGWDMEAQVVPA